MAELMAAGAALGVASSILTFCDVGWTVITRIKEYCDRVEDVPSVLRHIDAQLQVLVEKIEELKTKTKDGQEIGRQSALGRAVLSCERQVQKLDELTTKMLPDSKDSMATRAKKGVQSVWYEKELNKAWAEMETYKSTFIFYFTKVQDGKDTTIYTTVQKDDPSSNPTTGTVEATPRLVTYPPRLVHNYVDRSQNGSLILETVAQHLESSAKEVPSVAVLLGMGGAGKTQLALQYCRQLEVNGECRSLVWVDASSAAAVAKSFEAISKLTRGNLFQAASLATKGYSDTSTGSVEGIEQTVEAVLQYLDNNQPWTMVFDNYDQPNDFEAHGKLRSIRDYWPRNGTGQVLITSRSQQCDLLGRVFEIGRLAEQEAVALLRSKLPEGDLIPAQELVEVVTKLGSLALAVVQAGAYMRSQRLTARQFLEHYRARKERVLRNVPRTKDWEYQRWDSDQDRDISLSVFTTWELSLNCLSGDAEEVEQKLHFLSLAGFLDTSNLYESLFRQAVETPTVELSWTAIFQDRGDWDTYQFGDVISELRDLSLLESFDRAEDGCQFSVHPLISDWIKLRLSPGQRAKYAVEAARILRNNLPADFLKSNEGKDAVAIQILTLHLVVCVQNCQDFLPKDQRLGVGPLEGLGTDFAVLCAQLRIFEVSDGIFQGILDWRQETKKPWSRSCLEAGLSICWSLEQSNRFQEALAMSQDLATSSQSMFGDEDEITLKCVARTGSLSRCIGRFDDAERILRGCIQKQRLVLGSSHRLTLGTIANLAALLTEKTNYEEALVFIEEAYEKLKTEHGPDHITTLEAGALLMITCGSVNEEEINPSTLEQGHEIVFRTENRFGKSHGMTIKAYIHLAHLYGRIRRTEEAFSILQTLLQSNSNMSDYQLFCIHMEYHKSAWWGNKPDLVTKHAELSVVLARKYGILTSPDGLKACTALSARYSKEERVVEAIALWQDCITAYEASGQKRWDVEEIVYWSIYWLFAIRILEKDKDKARRPFLKECLSRAIRASRELRRLEMPVVEKLQHAITGFERLEEPELVDENSCHLLTAWEAQKKYKARPYVACNDTRLAIETSLPPVVSSLCDSLYFWHYYPDRRMIGLAFMCLYEKDLENAQIGFELAIVRGATTEDQHNPWMICDYCSNPVSGIHLVCTVCPDVAFHHSCYELYERSGTPLLTESTTPSGCTAHEFLRIPRPEWEALGYGKVAENVSSLDWILKVKEKHGNAKIPDDKRDIYGYWEVTD